MPSRLAVAQTFWHVSFGFGREWKMKMAQLQQFVIGPKLQVDGSSFSSSPLISLSFESSLRTARNASCGAWMEAKGSKFSREEVRERT